MNVPPAGVSPLSFLPEDTPAAGVGPAVIVADKLDASGEYASLTQSATIADGMVRTLLRTRRGSGAAVLDLGQRLREVTHVAGESAATLESLVREALRPAISAGVVRLISVTAAAEDADGTQLSAVAQYTDELASPRRVQSTPIG